MKKGPRSAPRLVLLRPVLDHPSRLEEKQARVGPHLHPKEPNLLPVRVPKVVPAKRLVQHYHTHQKIGRYVQHGPKPHKLPHQIARLGLPPARVRLQRAPECLLKLRVEGLQVNIPDNGLYRALFSCLHRDIIQRRHTLRFLLAALQSPRAGNAPDGTER